MCEARGPEQLMSSLVAWYCLFKSTAVVIDIADYQRMVEKAELAEDIRIAKQQIKEGKVYTTAQAKERIMKRFKNA